MTDGPGFAAATDAGRVRSGNEDRFLARSPLFAVADGMGGHLAGEVASQLAMDGISEVADAGPVLDESRLVSAIEGANSVIRRQARDHPELSGMGTTCTAVVITDRIRIAHVGDSRAYRFRDGRLDQLTRDHTLVASLVAEGIIDPDEARTDGRRNIITRALGADDEVRVDRLETDVAPGDRLMLCTDGLHGQVDDAAIAAVLAEATSPDDAAERLVDLANAAGGDDNVTVVVVDIDDLADIDGRRGDGAATDDPTSRPGDAARARESATPSRSATTGRGRGRPVRRTAIIVMAVAVAAFVIAAGVLALVATR